jgi:hypothetical protein
VAPALERAVKDGASDGGLNESSGHGYDAQSRQSVDDLVEKTR